jgi:ABC-type Fe3+ transport system substrate-binding protein
MTTDFTPRSDGPKATFFGKLVIFVFIVACGYGAYRLFLRDRLSRGGSASSSKSTPKGSMLGFGGSDVPQAEIGIAYGTEKKTWLEWAVQEFARTDAGKQIKVNLLPMGSLEGAQALVAGDKRINVWSPASSLYKETFTQDWGLKYSRPPIVKEESLALTPMVFVMWAERYQAFIAKYGAVNFDTLSRALGEPTGWQAIANQPDWGLFKFGHTIPSDSNSGLMTLVLIAYDHAKKTKGLALADIVNPGFQQELGTIEKAASVTSSSTGTIMREMVLKGPSAYDSLFVYESVVIDYLRSAQGRWGELRVVYPRTNIWNDNPYYIIDADWSTADQKKAAEVFLNFLMSEPVQRQALTHGFRPGNTNVPVMFPESPFVLYQRFGLKNDIGQVCEYPHAEVLNNLLAAWQRSH